MNARIPYLSMKLAAAAITAAAVGSARAQCSWASTPSGFNGNVNAMIAWDPDGAGSAKPLLIAEFNAPGDGKVILGGVG